MGRQYSSLLRLLMAMHVAIVAVAGQQYYGIRIGPLSQLHHGVSGEVYAVDARTIFIKNFNYDGEGPAAYFYVGSTARPGNKGAQRLRDERGSVGVLHRYRNKDITLSLPEGKTLRDIKWFSVWCDDFAVNFGDVSIPKNLEYPRPQKIEALRGVHEVSSEHIVIVDAQTLLIPNFSYDGEAPDAKFWVGKGAKPSPQGVRIPDENGKEDPLRRYDKKTIVLTLPADLTVYDIDHFGVWCEAFTVDFGHVRIPASIVVPPSLKMLGVSPQSKLNCEVLYDDLAFEVRWAVAGESVVVQLVAKLEGNEYMSFGLSPNLRHSEMVGGDVAVVWVDKYTGKGYAHDYILDDKSQCSGTRGSCPDTRLNDNTNSIRLLNAAMVNGYSIVTYQRPLKAADSLDLAIRTNESQAVIWALGPLNQRHEVSYHSHYTKGDRFIDFGRQPVWNCPMPESEKSNQPPETDYQEEPEYYEKRPATVNRQPAPPKPQQVAQPQRPSEVVARPAKPATPSPPRATSKNGAWYIPPIQCNEPEDGVFYAQMGPTGGKQGYPAITGHVGWGLSWYINGLLIPEINVVRGKEYTFVVEGGFDPEIPARYHPFYITDDPVGGYIHKTDAEKANVQVFAGLHRSRNGVEEPTGVGRLCNWTPNPDGPPADEFSSFGAYQRTLSLKCDQGNPGVITWTPDDNTPDTVYYHCFTHRYLGWKINVLDTCEEAQASEVDEVYVDGPEDGDDGIDAEPSIRHETKVRTGETNYLHSGNKELLKNHNMNEVPPTVNFHLPGGSSAEMTKLISTGIRAAEALEKQVLRNLTLSEMNVGEELQGAKPVADIKIPNAHSIQHNSEAGLPNFLKAPQNGQYLRPTRVPLRRYPSHAVERRPASGNNRPPRPFVIPQPSIMMSHYKPQTLSHPPPPSQSQGRPYMKKPKPGSKPILILGEPTEIRPQPRPQGPFKQHQRAPFPDHVPPGYMQKPDKPLGQVLRPHTLPKVVIPVKERLTENVKQHSSFEISQETPLNPAQNTGFKPQTVIVESGFRPIMNRRKHSEGVAALIGRRPERKTEQRRRADSILEIDEAIESDALLINHHHHAEPVQTFEPMFIPSPRDHVSVNREHSGNATKPSDESAEQDSDEADTDDDDEDRMMVAAERMDTFVMPTRKKNGDDQPWEDQRTENYPEGSVVTYDGKAVLDTSLLHSARPDDENDFYPSGLLTKTEELVKNTPQFGPYKGEMPPAIPEFDIPADSLAQLKHHNYQKSAYHNQIPVTEYSNPFSNSVNGAVAGPKSGAPISTKLTLLKADTEGAAS